MLQIYIHYIYSVYTISKTRIYTVFTNNSLKHLTGIYNSFTFVSTTKRKKIMTLITTIEVDEQDTTVEVEFEAQYGEVIIHSITDAGSDVIVNQYQMAVLYDLCHEEAANVC